MKKNSSNLLTNSYDISQKDLHNFLIYNPEDGMFIKNCLNINKKTIVYALGHISSLGYVKISIKGNIYLAHRLVWLYTYGELPTGYIDHINGIRNDNRLINLRNVTKEQNSRNTKIHSNNTSGNTGVFLVKKNNKWCSSIGVDNKNKHLGYFIDKEDAIKCRKEAEIKYGYHANHGRLA